MLLAQKVSHSFKEPTAANSLHQTGSLWTKVQ